MRAQEFLNEISRGDYHKKATMGRAMAQMSAGFARSPEEREKHLAIAARREKGLERSKARTDKFWAEKNAKDEADRLQALRDKYAGVDIDAEIEKLKPALQSAYHEYQYGARNTYSQGRDDYHRLQAQIKELERAKNALSEDATPGATSAASISSVPNPHIAIGKPNKSYTGSPGKSGTKAPKTPKVMQAKNSDGTAKNALDLKGTSIFGGKTLKRS